MELAKVLGLSFALATLVEGMVEYVLGTIFDKLYWQKYAWALMYVSLAAGIGLSLYYRIDLLALIADQPVTLVGQLLTGLVIGRGANYLHDFISAHILKPKYE